MKYHFFVVIFWVMASSGVEAWEPRRYEPPPITPCSADGLAGVQLSSDTAGCVKISGYHEFAVGWSTVDGVISDTQSYLRLVAQDEVDFGRASAVVQLRKSFHVWTDGAWVEAPFELHEAYVSVGDATVLSAGMKGSVADFGDDAPFGHLGLFNAERVSGKLDTYMPDRGVFWSNAVDMSSGNVVGMNWRGASVQITSVSEDGLSIAGGIESLERAGNLVGSLSYDGDPVSAHLTAVSDGVLDGVISAWAVHAGATADFNILKVVGATAFDTTGYWNALTSAEVSVEPFRFAAAWEGLSTGDHGWGLSAGIEFAGIEITFSQRWFEAVQPLIRQSLQRAISLDVEVTETVDASLEAGLYEASGWSGTSVQYLAGRLRWEPGAGLSTSLAFEGYSNGARKATARFSKSVE